MISTYIRRKGVDCFETLNVTPSSSRRDDFFSLLDFPVEKKNQDSKRAPVMQTIFNSTKKLFYFASLSNGPTKN